MASPSAANVAKVLVVGDVATGKTSLIQRYVRDKFSEVYQTTIGVDFALKRVKVQTQQGAVDVNVQLWDIAGQERFSGLSRIFYTHAVAAIIVFDLFNRESFESARRWKADIDDKVLLNDQPIPVLLLGNKVDLAEESDPAMSEEEIERFAREHNFFAYALVSAKTGHNIASSCLKLITQIAESRQAEQNKDDGAASSSSSSASGASSSVKLGQASGAETEKSGCC